MCKSRQQTRTQASFLLLEPLDILRGTQGRSDLPWLLHNFSKSSQQHIITASLSQAK